MASPAVAVLWDLALDTLTLLDPLLPELDDLLEGTFDAFDPADDLPEFLF